MPTPSPIMMPRNLVNSGIAKTLLSSVTSVVPMPIPNSATPTGRPMASTDPKARMRMTRANATPRISDEGSSNSARMIPPSSMRRPSMLGAAARICLRISRARLASMSSGSSTLANATLPASAPLVAICWSPPGAYGLSTRLTSSMVAALSKRACIAWRTAGSWTPGSARNTIVPTRPAP